MVTTTNSTTTPTTTPTTRNNLSSIGSQLVSQLGSGSGIDRAALVDSLTNATFLPQSERLTSKKTSMETQISDLGLMRSSLSKLQTAVSTLSNRDTFNAKAVAVPNTSLISITKLEAKATAGDYRLQVEQIAQSQSLSSATFNSTSAPIGTGTLTLRFGDWASDGSFNVNTAKTGAPIVINETNNTLAGLRDAINNAGIGVQASIVSDGGNYRLLMTAPSGETNEIEITATESADSPGLASFNFNENSKALVQEQEGKDAKLRVNGLLVSRESNHITDVIAGMEFDIFNSSPTEVISINITEDRAAAETAIRDFVKAYNDFLKEVNQLTGFNTETKEYGSLAKDPLAKSLLQSVRTSMTSAVPGVDGGFGSLSALGIRTEMDGSLKIIEDGTNMDFRAAMDKHYDKVVDLFTPKTGSTAAGINVTAFGARTAVGEYDVVITQQAEKGRYDGAAITAGTFDTTGKDYGFSILVDGVAASPIQLPANKIYGSGAEMAADMQSLINLDPALKAAGVAVEVRFNQTENRFDFISNAYGSSSNVSFASVSDDMDELGITATAGTAGKDVAGTVDGVAGFGFGNVLLPAIGSKAEGLSMVIEPGSTGGKISFSRGLAGTLTALADNFVKASGLISDREATINKNIEKVDEEKKTLEMRTEAYRARLQSQFAAMEMIVRSLKSTGSFLDGLNDRLPFTAKS
ncbi:flagellar filament capping protein FliD [Cellvibrio polysaccharolyticus]|uniref:Flagellar hook-associated protein 2 n=1 Tax=Cellvibrio polysaccharolyticus TaxID=2082724 RepID=A0A928YTC0_9GAMM|nr:flagellar filament capping protein FliD [Cellvibrio polysaccharolyticus]MBE8717386.1 flagellar hook protein [Cellvibrio polysaccharolyticus]